MHWKPRLLTVQLLCSSWCIIMLLLTWPTVAEAAWKHPRISGLCCDRGFLHALMGSRGADSQGLHSGPSWGGFSFWNMVDPYLICMEVYLFQFVFWFLVTTFTNFVTNFLLLFICIFIENMYIVSNSNIKLGILRKATLPPCLLLSPPTSPLELTFFISSKIIYTWKCIMCL